MRIPRPNDAIPWAFVAVAIMSNIAALFVLGPNRWMPWINLGICAFLASVLVYLNQNGRGKE